MLPYEVDIENISENNDMWNISEEINSSKSNIDDQLSSKDRSTTTQLNPNAGRGTTIDINSAGFNDGFKTDRIGSEYSTKLKAKSGLELRFKSQFTKSRHQKNRKSL